MKPEKTPYEMLEERYNLLKENLALSEKNYALSNWLKNIYKQDSEQKQKQIELYKQGLPSFIEHSHLDFERAKGYEKPDFLDLQMLN